MQYLTLEELETVIIDFTSHCNSMCGNCSRNIDGVSVNPIMPLEHMTLENWKKIFTADVLKNIKEIIFNGSYGDPIFNPNLIPALEYIKDTTKNLPVISIHTNGGLGTSKLWEKIAFTLQDFPFPSHVTFSIDGLSDTNHLYRRGVIWDKIMQNAETFISAGGRARWRMLVFDHNCHQIEQCETLAKEMGFQKFDINGGHTFSAINSLAGDAIERFKANKKEESRAITYKKDFLDNRDRLIKLKEKHGSLDAGFENAQIVCKWKTKNKIQISHMGEVFPCCYFLSDRYSRHPQGVYAQDVQKIINFGEENWNNTNHFDLDTILNHEWFTHLVDSWNNKNRYAICERTCGQ